jgi:GT2 family glycosyltransferase
MSGRLQIGRNHLPWTGKGLELDLLDSWDHCSVLIVGRDAYGIRIGPGKDSFLDVEANRAVILTASIVLYNTPAQIYSDAIRSFLDGSDGTLYVIDNSPVASDDPLLAHPRIRYHFAGANLGFGAGHNRALSILEGDSDVHLLLNPDIHFGADVISVILAGFVNASDIGAIMPKILFPDGKLQRVCRLLPTPANLFVRRFLPIRSLRDRMDRSYEMHFLPQDRMVDVPVLSGCFLMVRTSLLKELGGFDGRYFMYMEDYDLVRRIGDRARTVYLPTVAVTHAYGKGSYRSLRLLKFHMTSAIRYFNKWGWWRDSTRRERNRRTLQAFTPASIGTGCDFSMDEIQHK